MRKTTTEEEEGERIIKRTKKKGEKEKKKKRIPTVVGMVFDGFRRMQNLVVLQAWFTRTGHQRCCAL